MQVHPWPQCAEQALAALRSEPACTVLAIHTPQQDDRTVARQATRDALRTVLGQYWQQAAPSIRFTEQPGQPISVTSGAEPVWLSVSHAPGLSVAAVHRHRPVGIDVAHGTFASEALPDWEALARDYLGPSAHQQLASTPSAERATAFAVAWSQLEAGIKCHGWGLTEWTPALAAALAQCRYTPLALPVQWSDAYVATLAVL